MRRRARSRLRARSHPSVADRLLHRLIQHDGRRVEDQPERGARGACRALRARFLELPALRVRLFLDIQRGYGDTTAAAELVRRFATRFRSSQWPRDRPLPQVYYDPRSVALDADERSSLHAKVVVVDDGQVFVSSANFTEAAQQRNIEVGVSFRSKPLARQLTGFFEGLLESGSLVPVPLLP
jgi:phosphatidylserine/phosphatidylglycerophosphate/cardiolipin synthase-like enzyme